MTIVRFLRNALGIVALIALLIAANVLVVQQAPFAAPVLYGAGASLCCGLGWLLLSMALRLIEGGVQSQPVRQANIVAASVLFLGICIVLYAFAARADWAWDLTREGRRELAPQTIRLLTSLTEPVEVIGLFPLRGEYASDTAEIARKNTGRFLDRVSAVSDLVQVEFIDPQVDVLRVQQLQLTRLSGAGTVVVRAGGRKDVIQLEPVNPKLEERDFTNALINVIRNSRPVVYFLQGHDEKQIGDRGQRTGLSQLAGLLQSESYAVREHTMDLTNPAVPDDCDLLVIASPEGDLRLAETAALEAYMERGGRLLMLIDPLIRAPGAPQGAEVLRPWLSSYFGVEVGENIVVSPLTRETIMLGADLETFEEVDESAFVGSYHYEHPITVGMRQRMELKVACSVTQTDAPPARIALTPLLRTDPTCWGETDLFSGDGESVAFFNAMTDVAGPVHLAQAGAFSTDVPVGDTGVMREARFIVLGDGDIATNAEILNPVNADFVLNTFAWLSEAEALIAPRANTNAQEPIVLTGGERRTISWIASLGSVQAVGLAALGTWLWRRRYQ